MSARLLSVLRLSVRQRWRVGALAAIAALPVVAWAAAWVPRVEQLVVLGGLQWTGAIAGAAGVAAIALVLSLLDAADSDHATEAARVAASRTEERFRALTEHSSDIVWTLDDEGVVTYASPSAGRTLGWETVGAKLWELTVEDDAIALQTFVAQLRRHPALPQTVECRCVDPEGRVLEIEVVGRNLLGNHDVRGFVLNARDVTERNRTAERLRFEALHDRLTGLANRTLLLERIGKAMTPVGDRPATGFAVAYVDLDGFKSVNDVYGHAAGDELLRLVAARLATVIRSTDRPGRSGSGVTRRAPADTLARIGGDEFVVLLSHIEQPAHAVRAAERIQEALRAPFDLSGREVRIVASVGISVGPQGYTHGEELIRDADIAMYRAKTSGQPGPQLFDQAMHDTMAARLRLENELRAALEREEFVLHFQPIVAGGSRALHGFEALVRWQHPERGLLTPGAFLEVAEATRLMLPLGRWVIRAACQQVAQWLTRHPDLPAGVMSVNLSALETMQPDILEHLRTVLAETGVAGRYLKLELTESVAMRDPEAAVDLCRRIRAEGISVGVDDFGTGYCSLAYLRRLDIDFLKVDRTLVQDAATSARSAGVLEATAAMAKALHLDVVFEGLETTQHARIVERFERAQLQGYLLGRPMPEHDTWAWLEGASSADRAPAA